MHAKIFIALDRQVSRGDTNLEIADHKCNLSIRLKIGQMILLRM